MHAYSVGASCWSFSLLSLARSTTALSLLLPRMSSGHRSMVSRVESASLPVFTDSPFAARISSILLHVVCGCACVRVCIVYVCVRMHACIIPGRDDHIKPIEVQVKCIKSLSSSTPYICLISPGYRQ